jgi:hypothetical protein
MERMRTFGEMKELLLAIRSEWPAVEEIGEWPALIRTVNEANPSLALTEEAVASARRLLDIIVVGPIGGVNPPFPPAGGPCEGLIKLVDWHGPESK